MVIKWTSVQTYLLGGLLYQIKSAHIIDSPCIAKIPHESHCLESNCNRQYTKLCKTGSLLLWVFLVIQDVKVIFNLVKW